MTHVGTAYTPLDFWQDLSTNKQRLQVDGEIAYPYQMNNASYAVASTSNATPIVVTTTGNNSFETGDKVFVFGTGDTGADATTPWTIIRLTATTFSLTGSTAAGGSSGAGNCYEAGAGTTAVLIDAVTMLGAKLGISSGDAAADPITIPVGVTFNNTVHMSGGNVTVSAAIAMSGSTTASNAQGVRLTGTQPAATADPGANNLAVSTNQTKAWADVSFSGGSASILDGYNVASVAIVGGPSVTVTFARPMANATYAVVYGIEIQSTAVTGGLYVPTPFTESGVSKTVNGFTIYFWNAQAFALVDPAAQTFKVHFDVKARQ